jgi:hypothetical protein
MPRIKAQKKQRLNVSVDLRSVKSPKTKLALLVV